jgi:hypothetical protein
MKFVHLTHADVIGKIKQHGLRPGNGRQGHGVYCVPLMAMAQRHFSDDLNDDAAFADVTVDTVSTSQMWKWLMRDRRPTGHLLAVVFEAPASVWPLDVYLTIYPPDGVAFLAAIASIAPSALTFAPENRLAALDALRRGFVATCALRARSTRGLGRLLHHYQVSIAHEGADYDSLEVVIRATIAPANIVRLVPHYQTNRVFRKKRDHAHRPASGWSASHAESS